LKKTDLPIFARRQSRDDLRSQSDVRIMLLIELECLIPGS
jgi:hypothetical protein